MTIEHGYHPQRLDLTVHAGDPVKEAIPVVDGLGVEESLAGWFATALAYHVDGTVLHNFAPSIALDYPIDPDDPLVLADVILVAATPEQTAAWTWPVYAARLVVTATPPAGSPIPIVNGWIRFYPR